MAAVGDAFGKVQLIGLGTEGSRSIYNIELVKDDQRSDSSALSPEHSDDEDDDAGGDIFSQHLAVWRHHRDSITCLTFSSSGHQLATGSNDMTVRLYSLFVQGSKAELGKFGVRRISVQCVFQTLGGAHPLKGLPREGRSRRASLVNGLPPAPAQDINQRYCGHIAPVSSVAFSPTGSTLYSGK